MDISRASSFCTNVYCLTYKNQGNKRIIGGNIISSNIIPFHCLPLSQMLTGLGCEGHSTEESVIITPGTKYLHPDPLLHHKIVYCIAPFDSILVAQGSSVAIGAGTRVDFSIDLWTTTGDNQGSKVQVFQGVFSLLIDAKVDYQECGWVVVMSAWRWCFSECWPIPGV